MFKARNFIVLRSVAAGGRLNIFTLLLEWMNKEADTTTTTTTKKDMLRFKITLCF